MDSKSQKIFCADTWWGKTLVLFFVYLVYWLVFYGSWLLIPNEYFDNNTELSGIVFIAALFLVVPLVSFLIPWFLSKKLKISKAFLYSLHIFLIIASIAVFVYFGLSIAMKHFPVG